jgi:hypothetical protein
MQSWGKSAHFPIPQLLNSRISPFPCDPVVKKSERAAATNAVAGQAEDGLSLRGPCHVCGALPSGARW